MRCGREMTSYLDKAASAFFGNDSRLMALSQMLQHSSVTKTEDITNTEGGLK